MTNITKFIASLAIASAIASPALAKTRNPYLSDYAAAHVVVHPARSAHSPNPAYDVYDTSGHYVGSDPDAFIRDTLRYDEGEHIHD